MTKIAWKKRQYKYYKVKVDGKWFPRAIQSSLLNNFIGECHKRNLPHEEITKEEYEQFYRQL